MVVDWGALGSLWGSIGVLWPPFGSFREVLGSLLVSFEVFGMLRGCLVHAWKLSKSKRASRSLLRQVFNIS